MNDGKIAWSVDRVLERVGGRDILCLGVTYKPDSDELRGSPALAVVERLREALPGRVHVVDPWASGRLSWVDADVDRCPERVGLVVALVAHAAFRRLGTGRWSAADRLDLCGLWDTPNAVG